MTPYTMLHLVLARAFFVLALMRELSELGDPTPAEVQALLTREPTTAPVVDAETTRLIGPRAAQPVEEQETRLLQRRR